MVFACVFVRVRACVRVRVRVCVRLCVVFSVVLGVVGCVRGPRVRLHFGDNVCVREREGCCIGLVWRLVVCGVEVVQRCWHLAPPGTG